ncbi:MAG TPA: 16S rRNA processing protein RimM [Candidatus Avoscillospira stercorigallinarum]|uniref:Ribosome maturation factor RimM n=1 Tax=Candidatus Avoscillospira stercorigallinarum TaxID=2840708 RepID=A0A9D0Z9R2_9FIRM|nr:16S rRNA processing protein RimM [Candidatus Avoscillospira stercorigallinarum]
MKSPFLPTGQIVNTHGLKGLVKVMPWADDPADLLDFDRFFIDGTEYAVEHSSLQKSMVLLKLEGIDTLEDAVKLRGKEISIARADVELEEGVVFIADLIGLPVYCGERELGKITEVLTPPANDVYVVKGQREYLIPAVKEFIEELNPEAGYVRVRLIEGMEADAD